MVRLSALIARNEFGAFRKAFRHTSEKEVEVMGGELSDYFSYFDADLAWVLLLMVVVIIVTQVSLHISVISTRLPYLSIHTEVVLPIWVFPSSNVIRVIPIV